MLSALNNVLVIFLEKFLLNVAQIFVAFLPKLANQSKYDDQIFQAEAMPTENIHENFRLS